MPGVEIVKHVTDEDAYLIALYQNWGTWNAVAGVFVHVAEMQGDMPAHWLV
jgi:hypothetical protein